MVLFLAPERTYEKIFIQIEWKFDHFFALRKQRFPIRFSRVSGHVWCLLYICQDFCAQIEVTKILEGVSPRYFKPEITRNLYSSFSAISNLCVINQNKGNDVFVTCTVKWLHAWSSIQGLLTCCIELCIEVVLIKL